MITGYWLLTDTSLEPMCDIYDWLNWERENGGKYAQQKRHISQMDLSYSVIHIEGSAIKGIKTPLQKQHHVNEYISQKLGWH